MWSMFGRKADTNQVDSYAEGMGLYRRGKYRRALVRLSSAAVGEDLIGRVSRFYAGMSHRALGIEAMRCGRFARAEKHLRSAINAIGPEADLTNYLAAIYANTGQHEACASQMERASDQAGGDPRTRNKLAQAQWRAGRKAQAYMTLGAALRQQGDDAGLNMQLALFYAAEDRFAEARRTFEHVIQTDCTNWQAHRYLALSAAAQGDAFAAAHALQRAFDLRPTNLMLALELSLSARASQAGGREVVLQLPEPTTAPGASQVRQLANYVAAESDFVNSFVQLPKSPMDKELFQMLGGVIQMALADHGDYADLHYYCSCVLNRLGKSDRAMAHARRAVEINPGYVHALVHMARLNERAGKLLRGVKCIKRAIKCGADWPDIHCQAGEWMQRCRRHKEARKHFARAMELKAGYPRAARAMAALAA